MKKEKNKIEQKDKKMFEELKERFTKKTSVSYTRLKQKKMKIEVNKLDYVTGVILPIECEDEIQRLVV